MCGFRFCVSLCLATAAALLPGLTRAVPPGGGIEASQQHEAIAGTLRNEPEKEYEFNRAPLRDVLRFLASDAGISYVSVPEAGDAENQLVTFTLRASPFRALEIIARANGVALFYEEGVWYLRPYNDKELVARIYKLKYNTQEKVSSNDAAAASAPQGPTAGVGGTAYGGSAPDLGLSLQGVTDVFKTDPKQLVDDIKSLLGIPTAGFAAANAGEVSVDSSFALGTSPQSVQATYNDSPAKNVAGEPGGPQVIWNSDSNTLYIVASRQQHQWVEGYLKSMDRPQPLIAIEVKFFETNKDPKQQLGIDWSGVLGNGLTVAAKQITATPNGAITMLNTNDSANSDSTQRNAESGIFPPVAPGEVPAGPFDILTTNSTSSSASTSRTTITAAAPYSAVLSISDVALTLRAFLEDRDTSQISYPRVLTRNNREVVIRSVINQPVLASTSSVTPGIGGTTTASISYLPIGTIINVLPKQMDDGSIFLNISISISNILRQENIAGSSYPVASTRVFNAALSVTSGYTVAIGGLEEAKDQKLRNGVPFLKDIPLLGEAFKSWNRAQEKKNLIMFITPTLLPPGGRTGGISEKPESIVPVRPNEPDPPAFSPDGMLAGGRRAVPDAVAWVERRAAVLDQTVHEKLTEKKTIKEINDLQMLCTRLQEQFELMMEAFPDDTRSLGESVAAMEGTQRRLQQLLPLAKKSLLTF